MSEKHTIYCPPFAEGPHAEQPQDMNGLSVKFGDRVRSTLAREGGRSDAFYVRTIVDDGGEFHEFTDGAGGFWFIGCPLNKWHMVVEA